MLPNIILGKRRALTYGKVENEYIGNPLGDYFLFNSKIHKVSYI